MPSAFVTAEPPRAEDYSRCIRCGLCLNACPTYRVLGEELDSPRGRLYQVTQADAGRIALDDNVGLHLDRCLDCRACETACPSGVPYGAIIERTRGELRAARPLPRWQRWLLESFLPNPRRVAAAAGLLRFYQRSGLQSAVRATGLLRLLGLAEAERFCPRLDEPFTAECGRWLEACGKRRARVVFLPGCAQNALLPELNRATVDLLRAQGCDVFVPDNVGCCAALHVHAGLRDAARALARANMFALEAVEADAILNNAAGCGAVLKDYADLFPPEAPEHARAEAFSSRVRDVTEFLDALGLDRSRLGRLRVRVTYQDPCHLAHAQRIRQAPRRLLTAIDGVELVEMQRSDQCCGSAGVYNLQQPAIATALGRDRADAIAASGAELVVTSNPGCMLQLRAHSAVAVVHVVELLAQAHRARVD